MERAIRMIKVAELSGKIQKNFEEKGYENY